MTNRKERRIQASQQRRQPSLARPTEAVATVQAKLAAITTNFGRLAEATSINARGIQQAFGLQDAHIAVQYRIQNDLNRARTAISSGGIVYVTPDGDIDLQRYHLELASISASVEFLLTLNRAAMAVRTVVENTVPINDNVTILPDFGGDYAPSP